jgi:hypothetical protein
VVYLLMALCLYPDDDYEEVAEKLTGLLASVPGSRWESPTRGAITQARGRLGPEVVKEVFRQVARPAASEQTAGAWRGRWRLDGDRRVRAGCSRHRTEHGGVRQGQRRRVRDGVPQARVVAISECASHAIVAADMAGRWAGEQTRAYSLYERLTSDMLLA